MSKQINISEAREAFAKTTQGEWGNRYGFLLSVEDGDTVVNCEDVDMSDGDSVANMEWIAKTHNEYLAMLDEIERLRATVARQQSELGEYWRAAGAIESDDDAVSANGHADLHSIRKGHSYSHIGPCIAEMLIQQRDALANEVKRLRAEAKCTIEVIDGDVAELDVAAENRIPLDSMVSEALSQKNDEIERLSAEAIIGKKGGRMMATTWHETTHVPDFIGADEIEVAGVIYVRKGSQQSQPVNVRLLNAAKKYRSLSRSADFEVQDDLSNSITAAETQIAEREKSVTEEWLRTAGLNSYSVNFNVDGSFCVYFDSQRKWLNFTPEANCGDVLDLLRVLGGAT